LKEKEDLDFPKFLPITRKRPFTQEIESISMSKHDINYHDQRIATYRPLRLLIAPTSSKLSRNIACNAELPNDLLLPDLSTLESYK